LFQKKRELEEKIENLEFILSDKDRAIEELDEKLRSERTKFGEERDNHHQVLVWSDILLILFFPNILS
jgi:DNA gyrase/topoisomerase IV subunit A